MLPTKLARAALRGMRSAAVPPEAVVVLMGLSWSTGGSDLVVPEGGRAVPGAVSGAAVRCCARRPGSPAPVTGGAYVPTGYVPDGEVIAVTLSSRRSGSPRRRR